MVCHWKTAGEKNKTLFTFLWQQSCICMRWSRTLTCLVWMKPVLSLYIGCFYRFFLNHLSVHEPSFKIGSNHQTCYKKKNRQEMQNALQIIKFWTLHLEPGGQKPEKFHFVKHDPSSRQGVLKDSVGVSLTTFCLSKLMTDGGMFNFTRWAIMESMEGPRS